MPRHRLMWLEIAERQYLDLTTQLLDPVDARLAQLVDDTNGDLHATYPGPQQRQHRRQRS